MVLEHFSRRPTYSTQRVLEAYRLRWQVELVFKRLKQIAQLGHLPKHDPESAQAWLYGKLLVALLTEKVIQSARPFPPGATNSRGAGRTVAGVNLPSCSTKFNTPSNLTAD